MRPLIARYLDAAAPTVAVAGALLAVVGASLSVGVEARAPANVVSAGNDRFVAEFEVDDTWQSGFEPVTVLSLRDEAGREVASTMPAIALLNERPEVRPGTRIRMTVRLTMPESGDERAFMRSAGGDTSPAFEVVADASPFAEVIYGLRSQFRDAAVVLPGDGAALLTGLAIGDTAAVSPDLHDRMRVASLSHLTAVSGANCALVVVALMVLARALGVSRTMRVIIALGGLAAFVVLVTPEGSVVRAATMASVVLVASVLGRRMRPMPTIALAVIALVAFDPWLIRNIGFVLSVLATLALITLTTAVSDLLPSRWPRWLRIAIAVPVAAQIGVQPILIVLQQSFATYGVVANVLAAPLAPVATMLGLVACLLTGFAGPLATGVLWMAWVPSSTIAEIASVVTRLPLAEMRIQEGLVVVLAVSAMPLLIIAAVKMAPKSVIAAGACVVLGVASVMTVAPEIASVRSRPSDWQVAMCDIGQGDAVVVRSQGAVMLIDTGPDAATLNRCLAGLGVDWIDVLILTHWDADHSGGISAVIGRTGQALVSPPLDAADSAGMTALGDGGARVQFGALGTGGQLGESTWSLLWPERVDPSDAYAVSNAGSLVAEVRGLSDDGIAWSMLALADTGEDSQRRIRNRIGIGTYDIVKVAHHGSADQDARLYAAVQPQFALISVGANNGYGHPSDGLLETLHSIDTRVARSDRDGLVLLEVVRDTAGEAALSVWREHE